MMEDSIQTALRMAVSSITVTAAVLVSIALSEGYRDRAYIPVPGDRPTIGFGATHKVKMGDKTTPERALVRLMDEVDGVYADGIKQCIKAPLHVHEFGAFVSLAYSVGVPTFCRHARPGKPPNLIDLINAQEYAAACERIAAFVWGPDGRGGKKVLPGLIKRRAAERAMCEGF